MDRELLGRFRSGDRSALAEVYRAHIDEVERVVRGGLFGMRQFSPANLADVIQEVFLKAFAPKARSSYDGERPYAPFLMTVAHNVLVDWGRRHGREADVERQAVLQEALNRQAANDVSAFDASLLATTKKYVESLPPDMMAVHHHRFVLAEPQRQAAEKLGMTRQNLRTLERKLVDCLRAHLEGDEAGETSAAASQSELDATREVVNAPRR